MKYRTMYHKRNKHNDSISTEAKTKRVFSLEHVWHHLKDPQPRAQTTRPFLNATHLSHILIVSHNTHSVSREINWIDTWLIDRDKQKKKPRRHRRVVVLMLEIVPFVTSRGPTTWLCGVESHIQRKRKTRPWGVVRSAISLLIHWYRFLFFLYSGKSDFSHKIHRLKLAGSGDFIASRPYRALSWLWRDRRHVY